MIEISCLKDAFKLYQTNQIDLSVLQDIALIFMQAVSPDNPPISNQASDLDENALSWLATQESASYAFDDYLGGNAYLCETEADLLQITAFDQAWFDAHNRWPNITDKQINWDVFQVINNAWLVIAYCWNNAGGNVYYIPKSIWSFAKIEPED